MISWIVWVACIIFVLYGIEKRIEESILEKVEEKLKESTEKDDPYKYWDFIC